MKEILCKDMMISFITFFIAIIKFFLEKCCKQQKTKAIIEKCYLINSLALKNFSNLGNLHNGKLGEENGMGSKHATSNAKCLERK